MNLYTGIQWVESGKRHVSCTLSVDSTSEIKDNHKFNEILSNMNFDELDIMYLPMNEQHDVSEELTGIALAPADDATSTTGMAPCDGRCGDTCVGLDLCHFATPRHLFETRHLLH